MKSKNYQRKYLRAPFKESMLYADSGYVFQATCLNISEGGLLVNEMPSFPDSDSVSIMISLPQLPSFKNFSILKMQTFSTDIFTKKVIRAKARLVRREQLSQNLDNIFRSRFGLEFTKMVDHEQKLIDEYVMNFSSNLVYLQTLIDSFNTDEDTRKKTRLLASLLGYQDVEKIAKLRSTVSNDYKSLQWL
jgi:hypothetical protein